MKILSFIDQANGLRLLRGRKAGAGYSFAVWRQFLAWAAVVTLLSGCASYRPRPLPTRTGQFANLDRLAGQARKYLGKADKINLSDGLNLTEVAILAVVGNPDLRRARARLNIARAKAFAAGLLPDPQLGLSLDHPTGSGTGLVNGLGIGIGYDITALITRGARIDVGAAIRNQARLSLLWQEWQVIEQARTLAVRYRLEQEKLILLGKMRDLYQTRYRRSAGGLRDGTVTLDVNGTDLSVLMDSLSQIYQLDRSHNQTRHKLTLLLGLRPQAKISITALPIGRGYKKAALRTRLAHLADFRPDLLALKAGYQAQESRVRATILAQFPAFQIGISKARDTGNIRTNGISIGLTIPLFSGNRGAIAIERASRARLFHDYQARLARAGVAVDQLLDLQGIVAAQQKYLRVYLPKLRTIVIAARRAYQHGNIGALTFLNMETTRTRKRLEKINLDQQQWQIKIALQSLLLLPENNIFKKILSASREHNHDN